MLVVVISVPENDVGCVRALHFSLPCQILPSTAKKSTMITVIGSLNYDLVTYTDKVPEGGETFQAKSFENHLGGKGLNEALACAKLRSSQNTIVKMIGNIGADTFGEELKGALIDAKVDTQFVKTLTDHLSGVAVIIVETSGENRILITAGANGQLKPTAEDFQEYFRESSEGDHFLVLQNEFPYTRETIDWVKKNKPSINIAYNPSPFYEELMTHELLSKLDLMILNEGEALSVAENVFDEAEIEAFKSTIASQKVKGFSRLADKLKCLINTKNINTVIITMGSEGSVYTSSAKSANFEPSCRVDQVIDTTGAGDTFFGGVVLQLLEGSSIEEAVKFATAASGLAIQRKGAAEGIPTHGSVIEALAK